MKFHKGYDIHWNWMKHHAVYFAFLWFFLISILTALRYSSTCVNADVLLNSIMSLQNVTLYYWGQNRLLNVLPFFLSSFTNPKLNLTMLLLVTPLSFYAFVYLCAKMISSITHENSVVSLKLFIVLSSLPLFVLNDSGISQLSIGHIEYALPALLTAVAFSLFFKAKNYIFLCLANFFLIVAIGMNPTTILPIVFILIVTAIFHKNVKKIGIIFLITSIFSFFIWNYTAFLYGNLSYSHFNPKHLPFNLMKVMVGIVNAINFRALFILFAILLLYKFTLVVFDQKKYPIFNMVQRYIFLSAALFAVGFSLVFGSNKWIEINDFDWRYFSYAVFSCLIMAGLVLLPVIKCLSKTASAVFTAAVLLAAVSSTATRPIAYEKFRAFAEVDAVCPESHVLYAGDYWLAWPAVLRDLLHGRQAFGLAYRGEGNREKTLAFVQGEMERQGAFSTFCLNASAEICKKQIENVVGPVRLQHVVQRREKVLELTAVLAQAGP